MYEDSWYSYTPESRRDDAPHSSKHRRRESLLKQHNGDNQMSEVAAPLMEIFEDNSGLDGPPPATLVKRAKSYSDFYEVALGYLGNHTKEKPTDALEVLKNGENHIPFETRFEEYENDLLDASQDEYQLYMDQLALSERHLDSLLDDTSSALEILATLSESFKKVESQTTAFQGQCEDLLAEQKRLRELADEVGTDLQYYAYLEPLTRRLNAPGSSRLIRSDDFLDILTNLNICIEFMDLHPDYKDSALYKTRYLSLLERALNIVSTAFASAMKEVSDEATKQLKAKSQSETAQYILAYGNFESVMEKLGPQVQELLRTARFAFGPEGSTRYRSPHVEKYHNLFRSIADEYVRSRDFTASLLSAQLRKFANTPRETEGDIQAFARRCVQHTFEQCQNEVKLFEDFFLDRTAMSPGRATEHFTAMSNYSEQLEQKRLSHLKTLSSFLYPHLTMGADLPRICELINWLETTYPYEQGGHESSYRREALQLLTLHLWPLSDDLFKKAAVDLQHYKPSSDDLKLGGSQSVGSKSSHLGPNANTDVEIANDPQTPAPVVSSAFPTVKTAVKLLILYNEHNESGYTRPRGEVLFEILYWATDSLQRAATTITRNSGLTEAQLFMIKNLMLIRNLFITHEIPDAVRQHAELDLSPFWETIGDLRARKQIFNPLAYLEPLITGRLLPGVVDKPQDARKQLEGILAQQITLFTKHWKARLSEKGQRQDAVVKAHRELEELLDKAELEEFTKDGLWKIIQADE